MDDSPHRTRGNFCVTNELCRLDGVHFHPDDIMVSLMLPISVNPIRKALHTLHPDMGQEEKRKEDVKHPEIQQPFEGIHHHQQPEQMQWWEEFALEMTTWEIKASSNLYGDPPWF